MKSLGCFSLRFFSCSVVRFNNRVTLDEFEKACYGKKIRFSDKRMPNLMGENYDSIVKEVQENDLLRLFNDHNLLYIGVGYKKKFFDVLQGFARNELVVKKDCNSHVELNQLKEAQEKMCIPDLVLKSFEKKGFFGKSTCLPMSYLVMLAESAKDNFKSTKKITLEVELFPNIEAHETQGLADYSKGMIRTDAFYPDSCAIRMCTLDQKDWFIENCPKIFKIPPADRVYIAHELGHALDFSTENKFLCVLNKIQREMESDINNDEMIVSKWKIVAQYLSDNFVNKYDIKKIGLERRGPEIEKDADYEFIAFLAEFLYKYLNLVDGTDAPLEILKSNIQTKIENPAYNSNAKYIKTFLYQGIQLLLNSTNKGVDCESFKILEGLVNDHDLFHPDDMLSITGDSSDTGI